MIRHLLLAGVACLTLAGPTSRVDLASGALPRAARQDSSPATHREVLATLRAEIPLGYPVRLEEDPSTEDWGWTDWTGERFRLVIHPTAPDEIVLHEYAHMMVWDACVESDHDALWGVAYARCYRAVFED